jgi:DHA1 family multidrug resistance protein-like MFS transporter
VRVTTQLDGAAFYWLVAAMFTVTLGYGVLLPVLPFLLERLLNDPNEAAISHHTGWLMGTFMFALFVFAPLWGYVSDRIGRRIVIMVGLGGHILSLALFALVQSLWLAYLVRALSGMFLSAVLPVAQAYVSETSSEKTLGRRLAWTSAASLSGSVVGPALSGGIYAVGGALGGSGLTGGDLNALPLFVAALFGLPVLLGLTMKLPVSAPSVQPHEPKGQMPHGRQAWQLFALLTLNLIVMFGHGGFEVGITLNGRQALNQSPAHIGLMFAMCSVVMILVQTAVYMCPGFLRRFQGTYIVVPSLTAMGLGFLFLPGAKDGFLMSVLVVLIAGGVGMWSAASNTFLARDTRKNLGMALGLQTAAASVGQGFGSVAGGSLYAVLTGSSFLVMAGLMLTGALFGFLWNRFEIG